MIHNIAVNDDLRVILPTKKTGKNICVIAAVTEQNGASNLQIQISNDNTNWCLLASYDLENNGVQVFEPTPTGALYCRVKCVKGDATAGIWDISINIQ